MHMHLLHVGTHAHATASCKEHMLMQLLHAHSTTVLAQARPTMFCIRLVIP